MDKKSTIYKFYHGEHRTGHIVLTALAVMFFTIAFIWPGNSLLKLVCAKISTAKANRQTEMYIEQTAKIEERIKALKTNPDTLEKTARENFGLAKPGDDVYIVE